MDGSPENSLGRLIKFGRKHRFPKHIVSVIDVFIRTLSVAGSTFHARLMLGLQGCPVAKGFRADGFMLVRAAQWGSISVGHDFLANSRRGANLVGLTGRTILCTEEGGRIEIGDRVGISAAVICARRLVRVGSNVKIGGNARIYDHDFHSIEAADRREAAADRAGTKSSPVTIGNDVLIGANAIILKGVSIGHRCIVGAGAVVSLKSIPDDSVVAGNPAVIIRTSPAGIAGDLR